MEYSAADVVRPELGMSQGSLRLRRLQKFIESKGLEALLFVPGVDGKYNTGSAQAIAYILQGTSNRDVVDSCHLGTDLEDSVLLVRRDGVSLYSPKAAVTEDVRELLSQRVPNLQLFRPTELEAADPDLIDETKLGSFIQMLRGISSVGIPFVMPPADNAGQQNPPDPMVLEKWPLLQAYGLEGVGKSGFFTQNFKATDVHQALHNHVYRELDGHAVEHVVGEGAATLLQHWYEMIRALGHKAPRAAAADMTERQLAEPLLGYFSYGMLRPAPGVSKAVTMMPRIVFGARTNSDSAVSEAVTLGAAPGPGSGAHALHFVAEAADPRGPLRAARTYFLSTGALTRNMFADPSEEVQEGYDFSTSTAGWRADDALLLMRLYTAVVMAARAAMEHFALQAEATVMSARAVAMEALAQRCGEMGVALPALQQQAKFALWQCDHLNNVTGQAVRGSRQLKVIRLSVSDIQSSVTGQLLGGVVYADTFLDIPPLGQHPPLLLNLTEQAPALAAFNALGVEAAAALRAARTFAAIAVAGPSAAAAEEAADSAAVSAAAAARAERRARQQRRNARAAARAASTQLRRAVLSDANGAAGSREGSDTEGDSEQLTEDLEEEEDEEEQAAARQQDSAAEALVGGMSALAGRQGRHALGRMLTLGGGEEAVLLTGCPTLPAVAGTLWCFAGGLVFVELHTRNMWVLAFGQQLESISVQGIREPEGQAVLSAIGEAVVFRGKDAACGMPPACHLTTNRHVALSLASMTPAGRKHLLSVVLPAWQQTCRESSAMQDVLGGTISYVKNPTASSPFVPQQYAAMLAAVQCAGVGQKRWQAVNLHDEAVEEVVGRLDRVELESGLCPLDTQLEDFLQRQAAAAAAAAGTSGSVPVTLVTGVPGADLSGVVSALVGAAGPEASPRVVLLPGGGPVNLQQGAVQAAAVEEAVGAALARQPGCRALLLASCCYEGLVEQLRVLSSCQVFQQGRVHLSNTIVCVSADCVWEEPPRGMTLPGLLEQLPPGLVDALVLAPGGAPPAQLAKVQALLQLRNPGVPIIRGSRAALMRAREELLPPPAERAARLQQRLASGVEERRWAAAAAAPAGSRHRAHQLAQGQLQALHVGFTGELDLTQLRERLSQLGLQDQTPAAAAAAAGAEVPGAHLPLADTSVSAQGAHHVTCVYGVVRLPASSVPGLASSSSTFSAASSGPAGADAAAAGQQRLVVVEVVASCHCALRSRECPLEGLPVVAGAPAALQQQGAAGGELLVVGANLHKQQLIQLIQSCGRGLAAVKQMRPVSSVTPEERAAIAQQHLFDPLPDGYCFDGTRYRDEFGDVVREHPHMDRFIQEFIDEANRGITQGNADADAAAGRAPVVTRVEAWR